MAEVRPLYIEKDEGVGSIVSRVENVGDENLALVFPQESEVFSDVVELKFLKKQIEKTEKQVILITPEDAQADLAKSLGFKVKKDLEDDFQDEFLESFYQSDSKEEKPEKEEKSKTKPKKGDKKHSEEKEKIKKKRLQVSDIVDPKETQSRERQSSAKKQKPTQAKPSQDQKASNSSVEEVYKKDREAGKKKEASSQKEESDSRFLSWFSFPRLIGGVFLASLVALVLTVTYVFPEAEIEVEPRKEARKVGFSLTVDKSITSPNLDENLIPGEVFKQNRNVKEKFESSGKEEVEKKARGTVKIYNSFSSSAQTLVKTTRLLSESGKLFRLVNTVNVPGADIEDGEINPNYIEAEVVADEPGSDFNIGPSDFTIPGFEGTAKYDGFYAVSEKPMEGGKVGIIEKVTKEDKDKALTSLEEDLLSQVKEDLKESIPEDLKVIEESFDLGLAGVNLDPEVGEEADQFQVQATGTARVFALREDYVKRMVKKELKDDLDDKEKVVEESFEIVYKDPALNFEKGTATLKVEAEVETTWKIEKKDLKETLKGKNEVGARKAVADYPEIKTLRVQLWPFWLRRIPKRAGKIEIKIQ